MHLGHGYIGVEVRRHEDSFSTQDLATILYPNPRGQHTMRNERSKARVKQDYQKR